VTGVQTCALPICLREELGISSLMLGEVDELAPLVARLKTS